MSNQELLDEWRHFSCLARAIFLSSLLGEHVIGLSLNEHVLPFTDIQFFEIGDYAGMLPRKFFSFHCIENESNELNDSKTEGTENFPDIPRRSESDAECSDGGESPEKRLVDLEVMPVCEIRKEAAEGVIVPNLPNVVEGVQGDSHDESQIIVSHLLGEGLEVLDDSGLRQLIENVPVEFGIGLEEERSCAVVRGVSVGQNTESVTFLDDVMDLKSGNRTSTPSKDVVHAGSKRRVKESETEAECVLRPKIVAVEIGDESYEENMAFRSDIGRVNARRSCLSSNGADRTVTEFGLRCWKRWLGQRRRSWGLIHM